MQTQPTHPKYRRPLSSLLLTLALGCSGLPEEQQPPESHATRAQRLALPPGLAPSLLKDIQVGPDSNPKNHSIGSRGSTRPAATRSAVYFTASNMDLGSRDNELWRTDGTPEGTRLVRDFVLGPGHTFIGQLATVGESVYLATQGETGSLLWKSDGTSEGTHQVRSSQGAVTNLAGIISCGDQLFFSSGSYQGGSLWKSDGTPEGTFQLSSSARLDWFYYKPTCANGTLFFLAYDEVNYGMVLWKSNGTPEGTQRLQSVGNVQVPWDMSPSLVAVGSKVFFATSN